MYKFRGIAIKNHNAYATTYALSGDFATKGYALGFIAEATSISTISIALYGVYGTDALRSMQFELWSDDGSGVPSTNIAAAYVKTAGYAVGWVTVSPGWGGVTLSLGSRYWVVVKNVSTAPATNYINISAAQPPGAGEYYDNGYGVLGEFGGIRTWNGSDWTTVPAQARAGVRVGYTGGLIGGQIYGLRVGSLYSSTSLSVGMGITIPANYPDQNVIGARVLATRSAATVPSTAAYFYRNNTLVATSNISVLPGIGLVYFGGELNQPIRLSAGDRLDVMTGFIGNGSSTLSWGMAGSVVMPADIKLAPLSARVVTRSISGVITDYPDQVPEFTLYLDPVDPYPTSVNRRQFFNQR